MITKRDTTVGYHCPFCGMPILNRINIFAMEGDMLRMICVCRRSELVVHMLKDRRYRITAPCIMCPDPHSYTLSSSAFFQRELFALSCKFTAVDICFIGKSNRVYEALKKNEEELIKTFTALEDELRDMGGYDGLDDLYEDMFYDEYGDDGDFYWDDFGREYEKNEKNEKNEKTNKPSPGFKLHKNEKFKPEPAEYDIYDIDDIKNVKIASYQAVAQVLKAISRMFDKKKISCKCKKFDGKISILDKTVRVECKNCGSYRDIKAGGISDAQYLEELDRLHLDYDD